ncbi:MAG: twin-arginine translocase subunit TatC, partial [Candidatus Omnitrophica bacterium]|nr:twin-arginine translocase subunit TatC [Candidatus Omnitrophota bacterium]
VAFGVAFELPLVMTFLAKIGIATPEFLRQKRRHAIIIILIVAAVLTPPDVVSQVLLAAPMLALYELGIIFTRMGYKHKTP